MEEEKKDIERTDIDVNNTNYIVSLDNRGIYQEFTCPTCKDHIRFYGRRPFSYNEEEMREKSKWMRGDFEIINKNLRYIIKENGKIKLDYNPLRVEIGSGQNPTFGYIHLDMDRACPQLDIWGNIREMPFDDDTVDEFLAQHVIEHVWWADLLWTFAEINRIMKMGGIVNIEVPDFDVAKTREPEDIYCLNMSLYGEFKTWEDYNYYANAPLYLMHHSVFNYNILKWYLEQAGFGEIMRDKSVENISQHRWVGVLAIKAIKIGKPKPAREIMSSYWTGVDKEYPYYVEYVKKWG